MEVGGRQGSRLTGRLFSKMMDILSEELSVTDLGIHLSNDIKIATLLWVDDVLTCTNGENNQKEILQRVNEFAQKHKIRWGQSKCNVMRVGNHGKNKEKEWLVGNMVINETQQYRYLGDIISNNGKNSHNLENRKNKTQATTININAIATSEVLKKIEVSVLLRLHEFVTIPGLLANSESWNLLKTEIAELEKIEIQALKNLFDLPTHQPTTSIIYSFGTLFTELRMNQKRLIYLHRVLNRANSNWTKEILLILQQQNIGWYRSIKEILRELNLPDDLNVVKNMTVPEWERTVKQKIEEKNRQRLIQECYKKENGIKIKKTKTSHILEYLTSDDYTRKPCPEVTMCTKQEAKTLIIARFRMLECGANFRGTMREVCPTCKVKDDEDHRINTCIKYRDINQYDCKDKIPFEMIYSKEPTEIKSIIKTIESIWNTQNARGTMLN